MPCKDCAAAGETEAMLREALDRCVNVVHANCEERCGDESTCADVKKIVRETTPQSHACEVAEWKDRVVEAAPAVGLCN